MAFNQRLGRAVLELSIDGGAFTRGAGDAKATMRDLARGIAQTQRDINQQTFRFSGREQLAEANKLAEAVQRVGGAQRLTATEQARVNATLSTAIEKYRALGQQAPATLVAVERQTRRVQAATDTMAAGMARMGAIGRKAFENAKASDAMIAGMSAAGKATQSAAGAATVGAAATMGMAGATQLLTRALGGYLSASAILGAIRSTLQYAEALEKASVAAGGTAREVQRLENIAVGGNTTLEAMVNALTTAQDKAAEAIADSTSTAADAFRELGIEVQAWMELSPDEQIIAIADGLKRIASNERQIKLAKDILGRGAVEIMGALRAETGKLADSVRILSDEQVKQLADLESGWDRLSLAIRRTVSSVALQNINAMLGRGLFVGTRPPEQIRTEPTELLVANQRMGQWRVPDMVAQLKEAETALKGLSDATVKQLTAAKQLSTTTDEDLLRVLRRVGIDGDKARNVLKLFEDQLGKTGKTAKSSTDEWQQMLDRFNGSQQRTLSANLARAIGAGQLDLARMTDEAQQAIAKALEEGAAAWTRWGGIVPLEINRALAAVATLPQMIEELNKLQQVPFGAGVPEGDAVFAQQDIDRGFAWAGGQVGAMDAAQAATREHVKAMRDLDLQRAQFSIRMAEMSGAKRAQVLVMESLLEQRKRDAAIQDAEEALAVDEAALQTRLQRGEIETTQFEAELARRRQQHADHVAQINQQWEQGEIERREMIRRESSFWASELGKRIAGELRGVLHEATGRLFSTLFAGGDDEAKKRAKDAREDYERLRASGRASAEEITRAFRAMREAEEAAQSKFADRFKSIWDGIKRHLFNIFDAILEAFVNNLLKGMLNALMRSKLGEKLFGWIPGLGGGGGGVNPVDAGTIGKQVASWLGIGGGIATVGFSTTAGGTLAASMIAPSVASAAVPAAIASQGASAAVYGAAAGTGAAAAGGGGAAAAGAGAAGGGGFAGGLAAAGPWAALAAPFVAAWLGGAFSRSDGERIMAARRLMQTGGRPSPLRGPHASLLPSWITDDESTARRIREGRLFDPVDFGVFGRTVRLGEGLQPRPLSSAALDRALTLPVYNSPAEMATAGLQRMTGGGAQPAVVPEQRTVNITVQTVDAEGFDRVWNNKIRPRLMFDLSTDRGGLASNVRKVTIDRLPRRRIVKSATDSATGARFQFVDR